MTTKKSMITFIIDPHLEAYVNGLVDTGRAPSVSAVIADALASKIRRDRRARAALREKAACADPDRVARLHDHIESRIP